jgi:hypothetical protein
MVAMFFQLKTLKIDKDRLFRNKEPLVRVRFDASS